MILVWQIMKILFGYTEKYIELKKNISTVQDVLFLQVHTYIVNAESNEGPCKHMSNNKGNMTF